MHWQTLTPDPNSPVALTFRRQTIDESRRAPTPDRIAYLCDLARGRRTLDIGAADHATDSQNESKWLHQHLAAASSYCLGTDILADTVDDLRTRGHNVILWDITEAPLDDRFDVIIAGEVIEHVGRPGDLFRNARASLTDNGRLVLTTPNPYRLGRVWDRLCGRFADSVDHVTLLDPSGIAELGERVDLRLDTWRGVLEPPSGTLKSRVARWLKPLLVRAGMPSHAFCETMIYELVVVVPVSP